MGANVRDVKAEIEAALKASLEQGGQKQKVTDLKALWDDVKWQLVTFDVDKVDPTTEDPSSVLTTSWNNCLNTDQEESWKDSTETEDTFTYSFTEGLELGAEVEAGEDLAIEKATVKFSAKLSFSATQTKSVSNKRAREVDVTIKVPPCTAVSAQALLYTGKFESALHTAVKATGSFGFVGKYADGTQIGYPPELTIEELLKTIGKENLFKAEGTLGGAVGIRTEIKTDGTKAKCPPDSVCTKQNIPAGSAAVLSGGIRTRNL
jgi:hypothetical protein